MPINPAWHIGARDHTGDYRGYSLLQCQQSAGEVRTNCKQPLPGTTLGGYLDADAINNHTPIGGTGA